MRVALCASRILGVIEAYRTPVSQRALTIRIGLHVGHVLGAVLGTTLVRRRGPLAGRFSHLSRCAAAALPAIRREHGRRTGDGAELCAGARACLARVRGGPPRLQRRGRVRAGGAARWDRAPLCGAGRRTYGAGRPRYSLNRVDEQDAEHEPPTERALRGSQRRGR